MKNYLKFKLDGKKFLPVWISFMILFLLPYIIMMVKMKDLQHGEAPPFIIFPVLILLILISLVIVFYIAKLTLENIEFKNSPLVFNGKFGKYIGIILLGFFLSIITLGIYMPWFIRDVHRFFINNTSRDSADFNFKGKGGKLFLIFLLAVFIPIVIISIIMAKYMISHPDKTSSGQFLQQGIMMIIMVPYIYLFYKWLVNVDHKNYNISWKTSFWESCGKIAMEMILSIITLGIYYPLAIVRLYKYFMDRTSAEREDNKLIFGYDIEPLHDFLFLWGQILLTIITLTVYYPWAYAKIGERILGKTYLKDSNEA